MAGESADIRTLEVRGWLLRATEDLCASAHDPTAVAPLLNDAAFHAQQCAEKSIKAYLVHREQASRKTDSLTELGGAVARLLPPMAELMRTALLMSEFAWRFRSPGDAASVSRADALHALDIAKRVLDGVMDLLPMNCRPVEQHPLGRLLLLRVSRKRERFSLVVDPHGVAILESPAKDSGCDRVFKALLNDAFERSCAELWIESFR